MQSRAISYLLLAMLILLGQKVLAQNTDTLKVITITGKKILNPSEGYSYLEYDSSELQDLEHEELTSLLSKKAGLFVKSAGPNGLATISIRGLSANHTKLYWNNISISSPTLGLSDLSLIPTSFFNQINVNLGGASIMDGSGAMGGSINLINSPTKRNGHEFKIGLAYNPTLGFRSNFFSHRWRKNKLEIQSKFILQEAKNNYQYLDLSSPTNEISRRENGELNRYGFNQSYFYSFKKHHQISFKVMYLNNYKNISPAIGASNNFQNQEDEIFRSLLAWTIKKEKLYHSLGFSYINDFSRYSDPVAFVDARFEINGHFLYHHWGYEMLPGLVVGSKVNVENNQVNSTGFEDTVNQTRTSVLGTVNYSKSKMWGGVASFRKELEKGKSNQITPSVALYSFLEKERKIKAKFNLGQNLRLPTLNDLYWEVGGNPNLKNEKSVSTDLGVEYNDDLWTWNATYYMSQTENWIQWTPNDNAIWTPLNIKSVFSEGIEFGFSKKTLKHTVVNHSIAVQYRYGKTLNRSTDELNEELLNKDLILTPRHQLSLDLALTIKRCKINYSQKITSRLYLDPLNLYYLPYSAPASFSVSSKHEMKEKKSVDLTVKLDNVFGEDYQIQANHPMPGRNISLILGLTF